MYIIYIYIYISIDLKNVEGEKARYRICYDTIYTNLKNTHAEQHNTTCCLFRLVNVCKNMKNIS
jgi:hypothetical protein